MQVTLRSVSTRRSADWRLKLEAMVSLLPGRAGHAEAVFSSVPGRWPSDAFALASRARMRAQAGRHDVALANVRALVAAHPRRSADDWFNMNRPDQEHGVAEEE